MLSVGSGFVWLVHDVPSHVCIVPPPTATQSVELAQLTATAVGAGAAIADQVEPFHSYPGIMQKVGPLHATIGPRRPVTGGAVTVDGAPGPETTTLGPLPLPKSFQ